MFQAVGIESKKVYAKGTKADCMRNLNNEYPSTLGYKQRGNPNVLLGYNENLYPEPIKIESIQI